MTIRLKVLWGLRVWGPLSLCDLAEHVGLERLVVYNAVFKLRAEGLAEHPGPASYDITDAGRSYLERIARQPADQVVAPVPVRQLDLFE